MARLNYHHLYYFWHVARTGNLSQAARELHVAQSALSSQIRQLEGSLGHALFEREGGRLQVTEWGRLALSYAEEIFARGEELSSLAQRGQGPAVQVVRVGVVSTMSRNFVDSFLAPLLPERDVRLVVQSRGIAELLDSLAAHTLDVVLSNTNVAISPARPWQALLLARQPVSIIGPSGKKPRGAFPKGYGNARWVLPSAPSETRAAFDAYCSLRQYEPDVLAEVDDMAMLRLLVRDSGAFAILPPVVVRDELRRGELTEYLALPDVTENFYAVTVKRNYQPTALRRLLERASVL